jgi:hypothetical protein
MSLSNLLLDGAARQLDLKVYNLDCEGTIDALDIDCDSLTAADEITAVNRVFSPRIEGTTKLWAGRAANVSATFVGIPLTLAVSKVSGHATITFNIPSLAINTTNLVTLTNVNFTNDSPTFVARSRFTGAGEADASKYIEVCCSQAALGSITIAISNTHPTNPFTGNVDFDYIQF